MLNTDRTDAGGLDTERGLLPDNEKHGKAGKRVKVKSSSDSCGVQNAATKTALSQDSSKNSEDKGILGMSYKRKITWTDGLLSRKKGSERGEGGRCGQQCCRKLFECFRRRQSIEQPEKRQTQTFVMKEIVYSSGESALGEDSLFRKDFPMLKNIRNP